MAVVAEDLLIDDAPIENAAGYSSLIFRNRKIVLGTALFLAILGAALVGTLVFDTSLRRTGSIQRKLPPGPGGLLGTTSVGQSVGAQMTEAVPNSIQVGLIAALLGTLIGSILGFASGYSGGWVD